MSVATNKVQVKPEPAPIKSKAQKRLDVLEMIISDMEKDVIDFEGKPFTGKTLGELHGQLCATVQALAKIMKSHIEDTNE